MWHLETNVELGFIILESSFTPLLTGKDIIGGIDDESLRIVLREAYTERWGIFVRLCPVTLMVLSYIIEKKAK